MIKRSLNMADRQKCCIRLRAPCNNCQQLPTLLVNGSICMGLMDQYIMWACLPLNSKIERSYIFLLKAAKYEIQKSLNLGRNIVSLQVWVDVSRFSPCMINLSRNKNICCGLKKVVAKSRAQVYSEQQILALLLVFHQAHNLSRYKCARVLANQPISALHFFKPQQMFLLRVKLIKLKNAKHRPKLATKQCCATS